MMRWMAATLTKLGSRGKSTREAASDEITLDTRLVREPHVVGTATGDSWVLDDRRAEEYYTLPGTAGRIWELLGGGATDAAAGPGLTAGEILAAIRDEYNPPPDAPPDQMERDVRQLLRALLRLRVVSVAPAATGGAGAAMPGSCQRVSAMKLEDAAQCPAVATEREEVA